MIELLQKLMESLGLSGTLIIITLITVTALALVYRENLFGIQTRLHKLTRRPIPPGTPRPLLNPIVATRKIPFKGINLLIYDLVIGIENTGKEIAIEHRPHIEIKNKEGKVMLSTTEQLLKSGIVGEIAPDNDVGWGIFELLSEASPYVAQGIGLFGTSWILEQEFVLTLYSEYKAPDKVHSFTTPTFEVKFSWYKDDSFPNEWRLKHRESLIRKES